MNHQEVIAALKATGATQVEIARRAHCTQGLISQIATGQVADCSYTVGIALREFLAEKMVANPSPQEAA